MSTSATPATATTAVPGSAQSAVLGRFVWHDLLTTDPEAAQRFYSKVVGWGTQLWGNTDPPYTMWTVGGAPIGGVMRMPEEMVSQGTPPHWMSFVESPDVDATVTKVASLGGRTLVAPTDIPTVGRYAVLSDPQGATFAVFTPLGPSPAYEGEPRRGDVTWHELLTTDERAGFDFYAQIFGWEKTSAMDMGEGQIYQMFGRNGIPLGGMYSAKAGGKAPPNWMPCFHVDSADDRAERVKQLGGQVVNGPMDVPGGDRIAVCIDPQGVAFGVQSKAKS